MSNLAVKVTLWTDWSRGLVYGSSITVPGRASNVIIALASLWVGNFVAGWIWSLTANLVYHRRKRTNCRDGLHVQHQLVWRNVGDPLGAAVDHGRIWLKNYRGSAASQSHGTNGFDRIHRRSCTACTVSFLIFSALFASGVVVSYIASPSGDVLMASNEEICGLWEFSPQQANQSITNVTAHMAYQNKVLNDTVIGRSYATSCYSNDFGAANAVSCSIFTKKSLKYTAWLENAYCSFSYYSGEGFRGGVCDVPYSNGSYVMLTDMLDSSIDLGINAKEGNAIGFQKSVNCSVISLANRTRSSAGFGIQANTTYTEYLFGSVAGGLERNVTEFNNGAASQADNDGYQIRAVYANTNTPPEDWRPSPPFAINTGDVSLIFLFSNSIVYETPVYDPYFWATDPDTVPLGFSQPITFFRPVNPVNVMGCVDQYTLCDSSKHPRFCTMPGGIFDVGPQLDGLNLNKHQYVTAQRVITMLENTNTFSSVYGLGSSALKASQQILSVFSPGLPSTQWQIEVDGWFQTSLAKLQAYAVEYANNNGRVGPYGRVGFSEATSENLAIWEAQCHSQRIANPGGYQIISVLGIMLLLGLGLFLFLADQFVNRVIFRDSGDDFIANDKFQLQRMALSAKMLSSGDEFPVYDPSLRSLPYAHSSPDGVSYLRQMSVQTTAIASHAGSAQQGAAQPSIIQHAPVQSSGPQSTSLRPGTVQPGSAQPGTAQSSASQSAPTASGAVTQTVASQIGGAAQPAATQSDGATQVATSQAAIIQATTTQSTATQSQAATEAAPPPDGAVSQPPASHSSLPTRPSTAQAGPIASASASQIAASSTTTSAQSSTQTASSPPTATQTNITMP